MDEKPKDKRTEKRKVGDIGEQIACDWLIGKNFKILERNYLKSWGEIDIVAKKSGIIRFIEVKSVTRENLSAISSANDLYRPEDNIHPAKLKRLSRVIQTFLLEKGINDEEWQFDAITVYLDIVRHKAKVSFLEDLII